MSIQLNLSQDEVDYINTVLLNTSMQVGTLEHINAKGLVTKIRQQAAPQWVHVGNKPSPQWTKEDSQSTCCICGVEIKVPVGENWSDGCWDCYLEQEEDSQ